MNFTLTSILSELVLDDRDYRKVVRLYGYCGVFYLNYQDRSCENWAEKVSKYLLITVTNDVGHVRNAVWDPLKAVWLAKTTSNDEPWQGYLFHLLCCQSSDSLMQVKWLKRNLEHGAHGWHWSSAGALLNYKGIETALLAFCCPYFKLNFLHVSWVNFKSG